RRRRTPSDRGPKARGAHDRRSRSGYCAARTIGFTQRRAEIRQQVRGIGIAGAVRFRLTPPRLNIPEHRKAIDRLDAQIVKLLNERTKHVLAIGEIKLKAGEEIYAPHRERAVLNRISRLNPGPMTGDSLRAIYREIMSSALSLEKTLTVAYLGPEATFTHQPAIRRFGSSLHYPPQKPIADAFSEASKNRANYGAVPF